VIGDRSIHIQYSVDTKQFDPAIGGNLTFDPAFTQYVYYDYRDKSDEAHLPIFKRIARKTDPKTPDPTSPSVLYSTSFEAPQFVPGSFGTKDGPLICQDDHWALLVTAEGGDPHAAIQIDTTFVRSGHQSLVIHALPLGPVQAGAVSRFETKRRFLTFQADVLLKPSTKDTDWQFAVTNDLPGGGFVCGVNVSDTNGDLQLVTKNFPVIQHAITRDVWSRWQLILDLQKRTFSFAVNGKHLADDVAFLIPTSQVDALQFDSFARNGNDSAYLDDYSITASGPAL
jgi:hypothetical protein